MTVQKNAQLNVIQKQVVICIQVNVMHVQKDYGVQKVIDVNILVQISVNIVIWMMVKSV